MWHVTRDMWHVTCDTWHVTGGGSGTFFKMSAPKLFRILSEGLLKIISQRMTDWVNEWMNEWMNDKGVCRAAPATPVLLISLNKPIEKAQDIYLESPWQNSCLRCFHEWPTSWNFSIYTIYHSSFQVWKDMVGTNLMHCFICPLNI